MKELIEKTIINGIEKSKELLTIKKMLIKENEKMLTCEKKIKEYYSVYNFIKLYNEFSDFESAINGKLYNTLFDHLLIENFYSNRMYNNLKQKYCAGNSENIDFNLKEIKKILNKKNIENNIINSFNDMVEFIKKENDNFKKIKINDYCTEIQYSNNLIIKPLWKRDNSYIVKIEKMLFMFTNKSLIKDEDTLYNKLANFTDCNFYNFTYEEEENYNKGFKELDNKILSLKIQKNGYAIIKLRPDALKLVKALDTNKKLLQYLN